MKKIIKKTLNFSIVLMLTFAMYGCPEPFPEQTLTYENLSNEDVLFEESIKLYPDTSLMDKNPFEKMEVYNLRTIKVGKEFKFNGDYQGYLKNFSKFSVFIFSKKVIDTTPWDSVRNNYLILKRYDLDLKTLDSLNWRVTYR